MVRDLPKLLKVSCGKKFKLWTAFSDPSADNPAREAVGLLYNAERFSVSNQRQCWITAGDMDAPSKPWGDEYRSLLSAVFKDKATGKRFFVMTGRLCRGETPIKNEGNVIKKIEKALNPEGLPCLLLVDMNCAPKNQVWLSLLNYWSDTYTLMYPFTDRKFSTRAAPQEYESNTPKDWSSKMDLVCISRYVENRIIVTDHKVHREAVRSCDKFPSDHYPVTATLVFK
jgi:endonuclease/exonuclease/phosphatase family metal-dependent hydrolase